jgi:hypothetical protein
MDYIFVLHTVYLHRHLTSFIIQGEYYRPSPTPSTSSPSGAGSWVPSVGLGGGGGSGGGSLVVGSSALSVLDKDKVFKYPGRTKDPDGGFQGFVVVVFSNSVRRQSSSSVLGLNVSSADGSSPSCVADGPAPPASVSDSCLRHS